MSSARPDFENWSDEDFETRADEVSAYVHSLDHSDADWMSGAEYRLWLGAQRTRRSEGTVDERLYPLVAEAREDGSSWDRVAKMLDTSASDARERFGDIGQPAGVAASSD